MTPVDDIDSALRCIPADDRETWVSVGMALKSELGDSGYQPDRIYILREQDQ